LLSFYSKAFEKLIFGTPFPPYIRLLFCPISNWSLWNSRADLCWLS